MHKPLHLLVYASLIGIALAGCTKKKAVAPPEIKSDRVELTDSHRFMGGELRITAYVSQKKLNKLTPRQDAGVDEEGNLLPDGGPPRRRRHNKGDHTYPRFYPIWHELDRLEKAYSSWRGGSDVGRLNQSAFNQGKPVPVGKETFELIKIGLDAATKTNGAFDITVRNLTKLWSLKSPRHPLPTDKMIKLALKRTSYKFVTLNSYKQTVQLSNHAQIDLGGLGRGYALDRAVSLMKEVLSDFRLVFGNDQVVVGNNKDGKPWVVELPHPRRNEMMAEITLKSGQALSTSTDYQKPMVYLRGQRFHRIIHPRTGYPTRGVQHVTIVADKSVTADWMSTAVLVMGADEGLKLIEVTPGVAGLIVDHEGKMRVSKRMKAQMRTISRPRKKPKAKAANKSPLKKR